MNNPKNRKRLICLLLGLSYALAYIACSCYTGYNEESGLTSPVTVTIGVSDGENVQILSGLNPGETCYYAYFDTYVKTNRTQATVSFNLPGAGKNRSR